MGYQVEQIREHTWMIREESPLCPVYMYLLEGDKEAMLIDTGYGSGDLKGLVESLTNLPLRVWLTHAHFDHIGGCRQFQAVSVSREELPVWECNWRMTENLREEDGKSKLIPVDGSVSIDLGGRVIRSFLTPGHSAGCRCFLDPAHHMAFTGDVCCKGDVLLNLPCSRDVRTYQAALLVLRRELGKDPEMTIWPGHHAYPLTISIVDQFLGACDRLLENHASGELTEGPWGMARRLSYGEIGIVYPA